MKNRYTSYTTYRLASAMFLVACGFLGANSARALAQDVTGGQCPSATEQSPGFRNTLPDCRAYELVTPPYISGQPAQWVRRAAPPMSADGQHLLGIDYAGFAETENEEQSGFEEFGAIYEFSRTLAGWNTEALEPPASQFARRQFIAGNATLSSSLWALVIQPHAGEELGFPEENGFVYARREKTASGQVRFIPIGPANSPGAGPQFPAPAFGYRGASADLQHIVFAVLPESQGRKQPFWPGDETETGFESLYQYAGTGNAEPILVGVTNAGALHGAPHVNEGAHLISECGTVLGGRGETTTYDAVSSSGALIYFTAEHESSCAKPQPPVNELYGRVDGDATVAVSEPALTPARLSECTGVCREDEEEVGGHKRSPARYEGAAADGSKVFFVTDQPLLDGDANATADLYEADVAGSEVTKLVQVSHAQQPTAPADVVSVLRVSPDGTHVYFVSKAALTSAGRKNGQTEELPEIGGYNLYAYDSSTGQNTFVASLLTPGEQTEIKTGLETGERAKEEEAEIEQLHANIAQLTTEIVERKILNEEKKAECEAAVGKGETKVAEECEEALQEGERILANRESEQSEAEARVPAAEEELKNGVINGLNDAIESRTHIQLADEGRTFQTTSDGRYFLFSNPRRLTGSEDTSTVDQLFEFDASADSLVRVSVGQCPTPGLPCAPEERFNHNGSVTQPLQAPTMLFQEFGREQTPTEQASHLSLASDGMVVFRSNDALTPGAVDEHVNVYEYRGGEVFLVSPGGETASLERPGTPQQEIPRLFGTSQSGEDVFFYKTQPLVPQDTDTQASWYDARVDGGFPAPLVNPDCTGEGCQGALTAPPTVPLAGGSATQTPEPPPRPLSAPAGKRKPPTRAQRLAKALKACRGGPKRKRATCEKGARKRFGPVHAARARATKPAKPTQTTTGRAK